MNQQNKEQRKNIRQGNTEMNETYPSFIQLHFLDLKYMVPWSQYENDTSTIIKKNPNKEENLSTDEGRFIDKIENISLSE